MARQYSVKSASRRWPVHTFFNILDMAAINSWIVYKETTSINISRKNYSKELAKSLRKTYKEKKNSVQNIQVQRYTDQSNQKRQNCQMKINCTRNRTKSRCSECNKWVCGICSTEFSKYVCIKCQN